MLAGKAGIYGPLDAVVESLSHPSQRISSSALALLVGTAAADRGTFVPSVTSPLFILYSCSVPSTSLLLLLFASVAAIVAAVAPPPTAAAVAAR